MPRRIAATPPPDRADGARATQQAVAALAALPNLGPVSARWLVAAGITSPTVLRRRGAVAVFRQVALHRAGDVSFNLLYALEGAIRGVRWDKLPRALRDDLRAAANTPAT